MLGPLLRVSGLTRLNFLLEELGKIASKTTQVTGCLVSLLVAGLMSVFWLAVNLFSLDCMHFSLVFFAGIFLFSLFSPNVSDSSQSKLSTFKNLYHEIPLICVIHDNSCIEMFLFLCDVAYPNSKITVRISLGVHLLITYVTIG